MAKRGRKPKNQTYAFPMPEGEHVDNISIDREIDGHDNSVVDVDDAGKVSDVSKKSDAKKRLAAAVKEIPQIFEPEHIAFVFNIYAGLLALGFSFLFKTDFEVVYDELQIEPETAAAWAKPLARILSKYAPVAWAGMTAEIELIAAIGLYTASSFGRARNAAKRHVEQTKREPSPKRAGDARTPRPSSPTPSYGPSVMPEMPTVAQEL
jgi:hypothetical protein